MISEINTIACLGVRSPALTDLTPGDLRTSDGTIKAKKWRNWISTLKTERKMNNKALGRIKYRSSDIFLSLTSPRESSVQIT